MSSSQASGRAKESSISDRYERKKEKRKKEHRQQSERKQGREASAFSGREEEIIHSKNKHHTHHREKVPKPTQVFQTRLLKCFRNVSLCLEEGYEGCATHLILGLEQELLAISKPLVTETKTKVMYIHFIVV